MKAVRLKETIQSMLSEADVLIDGDRPWDISVSDQRFFERVLSDGSLGFGESYMDGWWHCEDLSTMFEKIIRARVHESAKKKKHIVREALLAKLRNPQSLTRAFEVGERHYDTGNDLFECMLDSYMMYSCGYWENTGNLGESQEAKLDLICRKLNLKPRQRIVDIGCGWGGFARFAAERYGVEVTGITISKEQADYARTACSGLPVEIRLQDYRKLNEAFDHVVSIGMFEHVGVKNYRTFFETVRRCLKPHGRVMLHTIGGNTSVKSIDPWIEKYIFPNSMLPSAKQITEAAEGMLILSDWHSFGWYYDITLMAWYENFVNSWQELRDSYDERFYRMWTYYLQCSAGSFRANNNQLWQIVFSHPDATQPYFCCR